jgi:glycerol-3-phosphate dehydrogenase
METTQNMLECDLLVVGGGINGAGIARDAAGRGLSVILCEKDDLASHTSSASTKLIHGGLRYLEQYEFGLVRKALTEREVLMRAAPHVIRPLRFVMPHAAGQRPHWMIRAGLFLYDRLARRELLPDSRAVDLRRHASGAPLKPGFTHGSVYSDGWVDDARLVVLNAMDAAEKGARIFTRTRCEQVRREGERWRATLRGEDGLISVSARSMVNATGPWAADFLQSATHQSARTTLRLVKGSHIVVRCLFAHDHAYLFQHTDGRIVFAIPYERNFTLIGTTDVEYHGDIDKVAIEQHEVEYLCDLASNYFLQPVVAEDVVWSYSGVRPLVDDASADAASVTRDYRLVLDDDGPPLLSVLGGKITTFRKLAEEAVDALSRSLAATGDAWTADSCLPGGDLFGTHPDKRAVLEFDTCLQEMQQQYGWLPATLVTRYMHAYGSRITTLLDGRTCIADMGEEIAVGLYAAEVDYLMRHEWAIDAADVLWRRSKLGLHLPREISTRLDAWMQAHRARSGRTNLMENAEAR